MACQNCVILLASLLAAPQLVRKHLRKHGPDEPYIHLSLVIQFLIDLKQQKCSLSYTFQLQETKLHLGYFKMLAIMWFNIRRWLICLT